MLLTNNCSEIFSISYNRDLIVLQEKDFESKDEFYRIVSELVKKVVEGWCSDGLDSDQLNEILNTIVLIFSDHTFPFSSDFNEGWIQFISRVVMNGTFSIDARTNAAEVVYCYLLLILSLY